MNPLTALSEVCQLVGQQVPFWVQGAGGNVSFKHEDTLYIKASGFRLDAVTPSVGVAQVKLSDVAKKLRVCDSDESYSQCLIDISKKKVARPSMETGFHAILPKAWVIHLHALASLLMSFEHRRNAEAFTEWVKGKISVKLVALAPAKPGFGLLKQITECKECSIFLLENHGVILQSDDVGILSDWERLESEFLRDWNYTKLYERSSLEGVIACPLRVYFPDTAVFLDRIKGILGANGGLVSGAHGKDRDAAEIWAATSRLYHSQNNLSELPLEISSHLAELPSEVFRRAITRAK